MLTIEQMQNAIIAEKWQWTEHIYNDGEPWNCFLEFTKETSPNALSIYPRPKDCIGYGRFERYRAWSMAYTYIVLGKRA